MLKSGSIRKYVIYAIGEIFLVMIGILLALQVNNWNQERNQIEKQVSVLKALHDKLVVENKEFDESLTLHKRAKNSMDIILNQIEQDLPYHDSLSVHFWKTTNYQGQSGLSSGVYETLKAKGVDIISNDVLREKIIIIYDEWNRWLGTSETRYANLLVEKGFDIFKNRFEDFANADHRSLNPIGEMVPLDFEELKKDKEYIFFLKSLKNLTGWWIERPIEQTQSRVNELIEMINLELTILE